MRRARRRSSGRRRNSPYGSTAAEYEHVRGNPRSSGGNSGVLLGTLDELIVEVDGKPKRASKQVLAGLFLAWMPGRNDFAIVRRAKGKPGKLSAQALDVHRQFHNSDPRSLSTYHAPDRDGSEDNVGLIRSLTYVIPSWMYSPEKAGFRWVHLFGDHGESGHGAFRGEKHYSHAFKPMLQMNDAGGLFIKRRPGNKYSVTSWIFW